MPTIHDAPDALRRRLLAAAPASLLLPAAALRAQTAVTEDGYAAVVPRALAFPDDHGAHPGFRIEWWYLTAVLARAAAPEQHIGVQVTFFRVRTPIDRDYVRHPSRFAARQILIAHAAIADPAHGRLQHDQRVARVGTGGVSIGTGDTALALERWRFVHRDSAYVGEFPARAFTLRFTATPRQPPLVQGEQGTMRKSEVTDAASHYYSWPQLELRAELLRDGRTEMLQGPGWLDHEWLSELIDPDATGWDWTGMNLDDGGALMAYHFRRRGGRGSLMTYASLRDAQGNLRTYDTRDVAFEPLEHWTSPRTGARYPVALRIRVGARTFETRPLMPDQELDSRGTTGQVYWEGASLLHENGRRVGRGYVELTGYVAPMGL